MERIAASKSLRTNKGRDIVKTMINEIDQRMAIETAEPDEASVSDWIKELKKRKIVTFEIPAPYRHSTRLVVAERNAGFRRILECGFDVGL
jgi:hypothetical protein